MNIQRIKAGDIEKARWDGCVHHSPNGQVFGYTWYLNQISKDWEGLVEDNYQSVMVLPVRKNILAGWDLIQPPLTRVVGIYSVNVLTPIRIQTFLEAIPSDFKTVDIHLNPISFHEKNGNFVLSEKMNYTLNLNNPYEIIRKGFDREAIEVLDTAENAGWVIASGIKPENLADFYKQNSPDKENRNYNFHALQRIMYNALHRGIGFSSAVLDGERNPIAVLFAIYSHNKVVLLLQLETSQKNGKGALLFLLDMLIRAHAGRSLTLDLNTDGTYFDPIIIGAVGQNFYRMYRNERRLGIF
ncbi:MAG TPA: hypothetical protein PKC30_06775 [Saprospiraceae bacterium]|nr:hypothetical protein [Saprospiraceae bacterium]